MKRFLLVLLLSPFPAANHAQWTHQYPLVEGFNHQVYLEGFELPILNAGAYDPAPAPDGRTLAFASRGWLWLLDLETGDARRVTASKDMDSRPEWSHDGKSIVFVRDSGSQLSIVALDLASGEERVLVDAEAVNLDPVFSPAGDWVFYASAEGGPMELWRVSTDTLERQRVTKSDAVRPRQIKRRPLPLDPDSLILYLNKHGAYDSVELLNLHTGTTTTLTEDRITAQADLALSPDGDYIAYTWPYDGGWELRLMALDAPETSVLLTRSEGLPLGPAFSHDGQWIWFAEPNDDERTELKRVSVNGGPVGRVAIEGMDWGAPTGRLVVHSEIDGRAAPVRMNVVDASGHPVIPETGAVRFDGENGRVFFYSDGEIELAVPAGGVTISAVQGFETPELVANVMVQPDQTANVTLDLERVWDAAGHGWYSADNHFHLNYGGPYRLTPGDIVTDLRAEVVDMAWPLLANLHNRFLQQELWGWSYVDGPIIRFGQEVRAHFFGHLLLIGVDDLFWPWIWGPFYQVYEEDDRPNAVALRHAREQGGLGGYVHPVNSKDPFTDETRSGIPIGFVPDAVLGVVDLIEVGCLWTDEIGTAALWHSVLNLGIPLAASAGSDVMNNYYRTMAIGATRVYVKPEGRFDTDSYMKALKEGRSFVSNGPMLEFAVEGKGPGEAVVPDGGSVDWTLDVHSVLPFEAVQIFVNGIAVDELEGNPEPGSRTYEGVADVPAGGWITARVVGENTGWPAMDAYLYAESSPVWFGEIGSTDPDARRRSAGELLKALDVAEQNMKAAYGSVPIPDLLAHFAEARTRLEQIIGED